ncbi:hypothetical protein Adt_42181 [Abeliophyllum distichum]|uniref:Uncharacterized protein n=1 Tax=Abeliophyllum distichum TaxID=126358 RepID=A0ABD1PR29_9LAMI
MMMMMAAMNMARSFILDSDVHITIKEFMKKVDQIETKANNLSDDLQAMGSTNIRLGSKNEAFRSKVEVLVSFEPFIKLKATQGYRRCEAGRWKGVGGPGDEEGIQEGQEERLDVAMETIALVNKDFDAMVLEKDK